MAKNKMRIIAVNYTTTSTIMNDRNNIVAINKLPRGVSDEKKPKHYIAVGTSSDGAKIAMLLPAATAEAEFKFDKKTARHAWTKLKEK